MCKCIIQNWWGILCRACSGPLSPPEIPSLGFGFNILGRCPSAYRRPFLASTNDFLSIYTQFGVRVGQTFIADSRKVCNGIFSFASSCGISADTIAQRQRQKGARLIFLGPFSLFVVKVYASLSNSFPSSSTAPVLFVICSWKFW